MFCESNLDESNFKAAGECLSSCSLFLHSAVGCPDQIGKGFQVQEEFTCGKVLGVRQH